MRPMARTLKLFREHGFVIGVVERHVPGINIKHDFLACIDAIALTPSSKIIGVQVFGSDYSSHFHKILNGKSPDSYNGLLAWLKNGNTEYIFIGWRKLKLKRGGKALRWTPRPSLIRLNKSGRLVVREMNFQEIKKRLVKP